MVLGLWSARAWPSTTAHMSPGVSSIGVPSALNACNLFAGNLVFVCAERVRDRLHRRAQTRNIEGSPCRSIGDVVYNKKEMSVEAYG